MDFQEFPKIARLSRDIIITEKIDGTNSQIVIVKPENPDDVSAVGELARLAVAADREQGLVMLAGSRTQFITPERDNHGFARWVQAHAGELWTLGEGRHFGEWWGSGIQRGYGLQKGEKRFSLFNVHRWADVPPDGLSVRPACCSLVPELWRGPLDTACVDAALTLLAQTGSLAAPGFMKPEGIVVFHPQSHTMFKKTIEKDDEPKSRQQHAAAEVSA